MFAVRVLVAACKIEAIAPDVLGSKLVRQEIGVAGFLQPIRKKLEQVAIGALGVVGETFFNFAIVEEGNDKISKGTCDLLSLHTRRRLYHSPKISRRTDLLLTRDRPRSRVSGVGH